MTLFGQALALVAALAAGVVNAIAGGGTLLTFPAIVALGIPPLVANATSTVALWPGSLSSMWGYRHELDGARAWVVGFAAPSLAGGGLGAWLLLHTPAPAFERLVPFLVLAATVLFLVQGPLLRRLRPTAAASGALAPDPPDRPRWSFLPAQFLVGVYGGYFGAGIGILMLAVLGFMGLTNIHRMNGLKNWGALCINAVAVLMFIAGGIVRWPVALGMAVGGIVGGYAGSRLAQKIGPARVRRVVVAVGVAAFVWLLVRRPTSPASPPPPPAPRSGQVEVESEAPPLSLRVLKNQIASQTSPTISAIFKAKNSIGKRKNDPTFQTVNATTPTAASCIRGLIGTPRGEGSITRT